MEIHFVVLRITLIVDYCLLAMLTSREIFKFLIFWNPCD
jgi:hypothetical protein